MTGPPERDAVPTTRRTADLPNHSRTAPDGPPESGRSPTEQHPDHHGARLADAHACGCEERRAVLDEMTREAAADGSADDQMDFLRTR